MTDDQSYHREDRWSKSYGPSEDPLAEYENVNEEISDHLRDIQRQYKSSEFTCEGSDIVNHPPHYNQGIETTDYIISNNMNFCEGNIVKYITRYKLKGGMEDLKKAKWYLEKLIKSTK